MVVQFRGCAVLPVDDPDEDDPDDDGDGDGELPLLDGARGGLYGVAERCSPCDDEPLDCV